MPASLVEVLRSWFEDHVPEAVAVYLFGSHARSTARPTSDVDLGVLFGTRPPSTLAAQPWGIEDDLRGVLGVPVQIVPLDGAAPDLVHRVLRDGVLVLERDRGARIRFEVAARNAYFDVQPHLERYRGART